MIHLPPFPASLRTRMAIAFSLLLTVATLMALSHFATRYARTEIAMQQVLAGNLLALLQPSAQKLLAKPELLRTDPSLDRTFREAIHHPAVGGLEITGADGQVLFHLDASPEAPNRLARLLASEALNTPQAAMDLTASNGRNGRLVLLLSYHQLNAALRDLVISSAVFLGTLLTITIALTLSLLGRFTAPLRPLTQFAREVSRGNWSAKVRLQPSSTREIQELNQAFAAGSESVRHYVQSLEETRELLEHSEHRLRKLVDGMHEILFELDTDGDLCFLNPAWERLTGYSITETLGRRFADFLPEADVAAQFAPESLDRLRAERKEVALRAASGKHLWVQLDADAQHDSHGHFTGVIGTLGDISESVELNRLLTRTRDDLYHLTVTDPLTGLYNRRHFDTQLAVILGDHLPAGLPVCLLIINIDGFKFINDTYGHAAGDEALRTVAALLKQRVRPSDYLARLSADEFALIVKDADLQHATDVAHSLHDSIRSSSIALPVGRVQLQCCIGVAAAPAHGTTTHELLSAADVALYHAKRRGPNRVEALSPDISRALRSIFSQGFRLRHALEQGNLMPAFQPICDLESGQPVAYEALARMQHDGTLIKASDFISVAEELGLTRDIDLHIIDQALRLAPVGYGLFLNLDPSSFHDRGFARELGALLGPACRNGRAITIEITEREHVTLSEALVDDIQYLRSLGCKLALDDFGSGYSTYHFLNLFRPEYLKIEGTFVRRMLDHESDRKIVEHIHELAQAFGAQTIAESVENEATRLELSRIGIRSAQGLHLGSPRLSGEH